MSPCPKVGGTSPPIPHLNPVLATYTPGLCGFLPFGYFVVNFAACLHATAQPEQAFLNVQYCLLLPTAA